MKLGSAVVLTLSLLACSSQACQDLLLDGAAWYDSYDDTGTCADYYNTKTRCESANSTIAKREKLRNVHTPDEACCLCGGGSVPGTFAAPTTNVECVRDDSWVHPKYDDTCADYDTGGKSEAHKCTDSKARAACCLCNNGGCTPDADWVHSKWGDTCEDYAPGGKSEKYACEKEAKEKCCHCVKVKYPHCTDLQVNGEDWHDNGGTKYDCEYYGVKNRCKKFGYQYAWQGMNAQSACCACGGGNATKICKDKSMPDGTPWHDDGGEVYDCEYYSKTGQPGKKSPRCYKNGDKYANEGLTANQACCGCQGGDWTNPEQDGVEGLPDPDRTGNLAEEQEKFEWVAGVKFYNKKHLAGDNILYWNVDLAQESVTFGFLGPKGSHDDNFWISMGLSSTGGMAASDVVTMWWANSDVVWHDMFLENQSPSGIQIDNPRQMITNFRARRYEDRSGFSFTRPWRTNTGTVAVKPTEEYAKIIYSFGQVTESCKQSSPMCTHMQGDRWAANVALTAPASSGMSTYDLNHGSNREPCNGPAALKCVASLTCIHANQADQYAANDEFYGECMSVDEAQTDDAGDCGAYDPSEEIPQLVFPYQNGGFEHRVDLRGGYILLYTMNMEDPEKKEVRSADDSITVALISTRCQRTDGWIGFGWSQDGNMKGTDVVIGWASKTDQDNTYIGDYLLEAQVSEQNKPNNRQEIQESLFRVIRKMGQLALNFERPLTPANSYQFHPGGMHVIYGNGPLPEEPPTSDDDDAYIPYHRYRRGQQVTFIEPRAGEEGVVGERELCAGPAELKCAEGLECLLFPKEMFEVDWDARREEAENRSDADEGATTNTDWREKNNPFSNITNLIGKGMCLLPGMAQGFKDMDMSNLDAPIVDESEYSEKKNLKYGFDIYWKFLGLEDPGENLENVKIKIAAVAQMGPGYTAMGFGTFGEMIGATSVIAWASMEDASVDSNEYHHKDKLPWKVRPVSEDDDPDIRDFKSVGVEDIELVNKGARNALIFTRPVKLPNFPMADIKESQATPIIVAVGSTPRPSDDYFGYHRYRDGKYVDFKLGEYLQKAQNGDV